MSMLSTCNIKAVPFSTKELSLKYCLSSQILSSCPFSCGCLSGYTFLFRCIFAWFYFCSSGCRHFSRAWNQLGSLAESCGFPSFCLSSIKREFEIHWTIWNTCECMYILKYIHINIYIYICIHMYISLYICVYMYLVRSYCLVTDSLSVEALSISLLCWEVCCACESRRPPRSPRPRLTIMWLRKIKIRNSADNQPEVALTFVRGSSSILPQRPGCQEKGHNSDAFLGKECWPFATWNLYALYNDMKGE